MCAVNRQVLAEVAKRGINFRSEPADVLEYGFTGHPTRHTVTVRPWNPP